MIRTLGRIGTVSGVLAAMCLLGGLTSPASGDQGASCFPQCPTPTASGTNGGTIRVAHGVSDPVPNRGDATQGKGDGLHDYSYVEEHLAPTCSGNTIDDGVAAICGAAVASCPAADQIRFWVWHRTVTVTVGPPEVRTEGPWQQEVGTYCLGPDDPGVPNVVNTIARAYDAFEEKVRQLAPPAVKAVPGPRTLVNLETELSAENTAPFAFDVTVAGATVHLAVRPVLFTWTYGDGVVEELSTPVVQHTYARTGAMPVRVDVRWGGTFTVGGAAETYDIDPPANVTGTPTALDVRQARAELIS